MSVILDANALINLYHAGVLSSIYLATECIVPSEVYDEVITKGQQAGHADAGEIAEVIGPRTAELVDIPPELGRMGLGEAAVLSLYLIRLGRSYTGNDVIVSDDQQFLRLLRRRIRDYGVDIQHVTTAGFLASLVDEGRLSGTQATGALHRMSSKMRESDFQAALQRLETL